MKVSGINCKSQDEIVLASSSAEQIWEAYKLKCETSFITRNGMIACGITESSPFEEIYRKPEFVAEHEGRAAFLFALIVMHYDSVLVPEMYDYPGQQYRNIASLMMLLLCHDVGEINCGDILDDGNVAHEQMRSEEDRVMRNLFACFPAKVQPQMIKKRRDFESYSGEEGTQLAKAVDKAEAIAFQLFLMTKNIKGSVLEKKPPSKRDIETANLIGTARAVDVWCLHYRVVTKRMSPAITIPLYEFLSVGFHEVFGSELPCCMTMDISEINLE